MKKRIHIDIENDKGEPECYEKFGGFFTAIAAVYAIWRYGKGQIQIGGKDDEDAS